MFVAVADRLQVQRDITVARNTPRRSQISRLPGRANGWPQVKVLRQLLCIGFLSRAITIFSLAARVRIANFVRFICAAMAIILKLEDASTRSCSSCFLRPRIARFRAARYPVVSVRMDPRPLHTLERDGAFSCCYREHLRREIRIAFSQNPMPRYWTELCYGL